MNYWREIFLNIVFIVAVHCATQSVGSTLKGQQSKLAETLYAITPYNSSDLSLRSPLDRALSPDGTPIFDIRVDILPDQCRRLRSPTNCAEATACTKLSGYYRIHLATYNNSSSQFLVECNAHTDGGDWTVIQKRQDGSVDFYRTWHEYKAGVGDINGEYFIGLDKLYALTNAEAPQELLIQMTLKNTSGTFSAEAKYSSFAIGNESEKYVLKRVGVYSGNAGDALTYHVGSKFTTKDVNNDIAAGVNCAIRSMGAWWYNDCQYSNLNGHYGDSDTYKAVRWNTFTNAKSSLKTVTMMIRRRRY